MHTLIIHSKIRRPAKSDGCELQLNSNYIGY